MNNDAGAMLIAFGLVALSGSVIGFLAGVIVGILA